MPMDPGTLRRRVQIQEPVVEARTPEGGIDTEWQTVAHAWAEFKPLSGREFWEADQVQSDIRHQVKIRRDPDVVVTNKHRLLMTQYERGPVFHIETVLELNGDLLLYGKELGSGRAVHGVLTSKEPETH